MSLERTVQVVSAALGLLLAAGCGAKTAISTGASSDAAVPEDASPDAMGDGDAGGGPLEVDCGRRMQFTTPRRELMLLAEVRAEAPLVREGWQVEDRPVGADVRLTPPDARVTTFWQDRPGRYRLRFEAVDAMGRRASCEVTVESVVGPPRAICPEEEVTTLVGEPVFVEGGGVDDDGVVSFAWEVLEGPGRASLRPTDAPTTTFQAAEAGPYRLRLTVTDIDGATDSCEATVRVLAPPVLSCPEEVRGPTRRPLQIQVSARDETRVVSGAWEMRERPPESMAVLDRGRRRGDRFTVRFVPDRKGTYVVRFTARDTDGMESSCDIRVVGEPTPPTVSCPAVVEVRPLTEATVEAVAEDDGTVVRWQWRLVEGPPGSDASPPRPPDAPATRFTPDLAGEYRLVVTVTDDDGMTGSCETVVRAVADEGIRVEMFWDTDGTDMDLHLMRPEGTRWRSRDDCYYANCQARPDPVLEWGRPGPADNPALDIDDTDGFGPENINVDEPYDGVYRVGVYAYNGSGSVMVRIYCGGDRTEPRVTFGPRMLRGVGGQHDFWRVADIDVRGFGCDVSALDRVQPVRHDGRPFPR